MLINALNNVANSNILQLGIGMCVEHAQPIDDHIHEFLRLLSTHNYLVDLHHTGEFCCPPYVVCPTHPHLTACAHSLLATEIMLLHLGGALKLELEKRNSRFLIRSSRDYDFKRSSSIWWLRTWHSLDMRPFPCTSAPILNHIRMCHNFLSMACPQRSKAETCQMFSRNFDK